MSTDFICKRRELKQDLPGNITLYAIEFENISQTYLQLRSNRNATQESVIKVEDDPFIYDCESLSKQCDEYLQKLETAYSDLKSIVDSILEKKKKVEAIYYNLNKIIIEKN